jgi:hypothetical protein
MLYMCPVRCTSEDETPCREQRCPRFVRRHKYAAACRASEFEEQKLFVHGWARRLQCKNVRDTPLSWFGNVCVENRWYENLTEIRGLSDGTAVRSEHAIPSFARTMGCHSPCRVAGNERYIPGLARSRSI